MAGNGWKWKWSLARLNIGIVGMTMALLVAGYEQSPIERAIKIKELDREDDADAAPVPA